MEATERLILALEKDCQVYEEILKLGEEKKQVIVDGNIHQLEAMTKREQALIASLMKLEDIRDMVVGDLMKQHGITKVETLDDVITHVPPQFQTKLKAVKRRLSNIMKDVKIVNTANGSLIEQSLEIIDFNVNLMSNFGQRETNYSGKANIQYEKDKRNGFDVKV